MSASLSGEFNLQEFTDLGALAVGYRLYTYTAGTTTFKTAYTDAAGSIAHTYTSDGIGGQYIALNARGELPAPLFLTLGAYDVALKTSAGVTVWTRRAIGASDVASQGFADLANTSDPTKGMNLVGTIIGNGVADNSSELAAAVATGLPIRIKGVLVIGTPTTITVPILDTIAQIFTPTSQVTIDNGLPVRPEWFGSASGNVYKAAKVLPQPKGGVVALRQATYPDQGFAYNVAYMDVPNVTFRGTKMPLLASDCKSLTGGTIINGAFLIFADNVGVENLGIDCGFTYIAAGAAKDALVCTFNSDAAKAANAQHKGLRLHNVIGLCKGPTDTVHGVIAGEGYADVTCTGEIVGVYGLHGVVFKCAQVKAEQLTALLNGTDGVIIKSDAQTTAVSNVVQVGRILTLANGPAGWAPYVLPTTTAGASNFGILLHAFAANVSKVQIGEVVESGHATGLKTQFDGAFVLDSVKIGTIITDGNADAGVWLTASGAAGASMQRVQIGKVEARNAPNGVIFDWVTASAVKVGSVHAVNCTTAAVALTSNANPMIDTVTAENCAAAYQITSLAKPLVGKTILTGSTALYYQASGSGLVPALSNSWAQVGGGDTFNVIPAHYGIELNGLISSGTTNVVMTLPAFARPPTEKRLMLQGRAGGTQSAVPVVIASSGVVTINDAAGGIANVSNYLSLAGISYSLTN